MISPSEKAEIWYMTVEVEFVRRKQKRKVEAWIISCFDDPTDIMMYDGKTMNRLTRQGYGSSKARSKPVTIKRVIEKKSLGKSQLTIDEHKEQGVPNRRRR